MEANAFLEKIEIKDNTFARQFETFLMVSTMMNSLTIYLKTLWKLLMKES
jgi:hypothetical protein